MKDEEKRKLNKILIPLIRKQLPSIIAKQIVGVQPMTGSMNNIFKLKVNHSVEAWRKRFIFWPKKSIYGKMIFGLVNKRGAWREMPPNPDHGLSDLERVVEYATNKEVFKLKLAGSDK